MYSRYNPILRRYPETAKVRAATLDSQTLFDMFRESEIRDVEFSVEKQQAEHLKALKVQHRKPRFLENVRSYLTRIRHGY